MPYTKRKSAKTLKAEAKKRKTVSIIDERGQTDVCNPRTIDSINTVSTVAQLLHEHAFSHISEDDIPLTDHSIPIGVLDVASMILHAQFDTRYGCLPPSTVYQFMVSEGGVPQEHSTPADENSVQIHYTNGHYVVSAQKDGLVTVYDSLYQQSRVASLQNELWTLYPILKGDQNCVVRYVTPQSQGSTNLCGGFAVMNCFMLLSGLDPSHVNIEAPKIRKHLRLCLSEGLISLPPFISTNALPQQTTFKLHKPVSSHTEQKSTSAKYPNLTSAKHSKPSTAEKPNLTAAKQPKQTSKKQSNPTSAEQPISTSAKQPKQTSTKQSDVASAKQRILKSHKQPTPMSTKQSEETPAKQPKRTSAKQPVRTSVKKPKHTSHKQPEQTSTEHSNLTSAKNPIQTSAKLTSTKPPEPTSDRQTESTTESNQYDSGTKDLLFKYFSNQDAQLQKKMMKNDRERIKYNANIYYRERKKQQSKKRYDDPASKETIKKRVQARNHETTVKEKIKKRVQEHYHKPIVKEKIKKRVQEHYHKPMENERIKKRVQERYYHDPKAKETIKKKAKERYYNPTTKEIIKNQANARYTDSTTKGTIKKQAKSRYIRPETKKIIIDQAKKRYAATKELIKEQKKIRQQSKKKQIQEDISLAIEEFNKSCKDYPVFVCTICQMFKFKSQVLRLNKDSKNHKQRECIQYLTDNNP